MLKLIKVAVTGFPATGKSSFCQFLRSFGSFVLEADEIVHEIYAANAEVRQQITSILGPEILIEGKISVDKVANVVFSDFSKLRAIEKILHPLVLEKIIQGASEAAQKKAPLFVVEVPLLYETGFEKYFDHVVIITSEKEKALNRFSQKKSIDEYSKREKRFTSLPLHLQDADYVVKNNGTLQELKNNAKKLFNDLNKNL
jgi:dephospho-CoA kinase